VQRKASYTLLDISSWIHLPPADFELSLRENAIILRPMEDTTIGVQAKMNKGFVPEIHLSKAVIEHPGIELNFVSDKIYLSPAGAVPASLKVKLLENASIREHIIPISGIPYYSSQISESSNNKQVNLSIIVQDKLKWQEQVVIFLKDWGIVVDLIAGGAASQFWTLMFEKIKKDKKKRQ